MRVTAMGRAALLALAAGCTRPVPVPEPQPATPPWRAVGQAPNGVLLLDTAHIVTDSFGTLVRLRFLEAPYILRDRSRRQFPGPVKFTDLLVYVDCRGRRVREIELTLLDSLGGRIGHQEFAQTTWTASASHESAQVYLDPVCDGLRAAHKP